MSGVTGQLGELDGGEELHEGLFISAGRRWRGGAAVVAGRRLGEATLMALSRLRASRSGVSSGEAAEGDGTARAGAPVQVEGPGRSAWSSASSSARAVRARAARQWCCAVDGLRDEHPGSH